MNKPNEVGPLQHVVPGAERGSSSLLGAAQRAVPGDKRWREQKREVERRLSEARQVVDRGPIEGLECCHWFQMAAVAVLERFLATHFVQPRQPSGAGNVVVSDSGEKV